MKSFQEIELIPQVQRALADEQYVTPTPIQAQTIPAALEGRDILGCAQTGTGKTAAFALPILNKLGQRSRKAQPNRPYVLVLAPTRELAIQIRDSFATYGKHLQLRQTLVYGGVSQMNQVRALQRGAHIVVATPGRLLDLMNQGHIKLDQLEVFVLDEADRMLDMGFMPDLKRIISRLPEQRQSLFFSATVSPKIKELTEDLLRNPVRINVTPKVTSVASIEQKVMFVDRKGKQALLNGLLKSSGVDRTLVFTKTKRGADQVTTQLIRGGIKAVAIHGNKSQNARQRALESFRNNHVQVLVATDVAARGIDVDGISHVVNFDLPIEPECYVHRIGRTGRAGATGIAVSFCSGGERGELKAIERLIGHAVPVDKSYKPVETEPEEQRTEPQAHTHSGSYAGARSQSRPPKSSYRGQRPPRRPGAPSQRQSAPRAEGATHVVTHEGGQQRSGNGQHSSSGQGAGNGQSRKPKGRSRRPRARQMG